MRKLLIVGAGGHGKCCLDIAKEQYETIAFLDDQDNKEVNGYQIIGKCEELSSFYPEYTEILIAIGNNEVRKKLTLQAMEIGYELITLISQHAVISEYAHIGKGAVIFPNAVVEANSNIGQGSIITANTTINHDAKIEDYVLIYSNTVIRPETRIGSLSMIGSNAVICFGAKLNVNTKVADGSVIEQNQEYAFEIGV